MKISYDLSILNNKPSYNNKNNMILYCIEIINDLPYIYFLMNKNTNDIIQLPFTNVIDDYMKQSFTLSTYEYKGTIEFKDENYVFYKINSNETDFLPCYYEDTLWKVTPFEILYSGTVLQFPIDIKCILFFKSNPEFLLIKDKDIRYEMPVIAYVGIGISELKEQLLLTNKNKTNGRFKKGYYFNSCEKSFNSAIYDTNGSDYIIKLVNNSIEDILPIENTEVTIKNGKFYLGHLFIGDVPPHCKKTTYELYYFNEEIIYLKSNEQNLCTSKYDKKREEDGCLIRYCLFLGNHWVGSRAKKNYDSFAYDEEYMIKNIDNFVCISYHIIDKNLEIDRFKKDVIIKIK
jgi:hypothetical protein